MQWRVEPEFVEAYERRSQARIGNSVLARHHDPGYLSRRPDTQPFPLSPQPVHQRDMKAVELDAGMKVVFQLVDNHFAQNRFGAVQRDGDYHTQDDEQHEQAAPGPDQPSMFAPRPHPRLLTACRLLLSQGRPGDRNHDSVRCFDRLRPSDSPLFRFLEPLVPFPLAPLFPAFR